MKRKRVMKRKQNVQQRGTNITDLNFDVLKLIMVCVAKSSDGAGSFARAISVCKAFMELAEDPEVLKAVAFAKGSPSDVDGSFWKFNGLLSKCASARNVAAVSILLTYLEERVEYTRAKETAIESAFKDFVERADAVQAVYTRARLRAATLAGKKVNQMLQDVRVDIDEIRQHLERFKVKGFFEGM